MTYKVGDWAVILLQFKKKKKNAEGALWGGGSLLGQKWCYKINHNCKMARYSENNFKSKST